MVVFKLSKYGDSLGTRLLGAQIRADLRPLLDGEKKVVFDFSGIDIITNAFADECIAKLLLEMPLETLISKTTFKNVDPLAERSILSALKRCQMLLQNTVSQ